jgi:L-2-hydroxyglutarate oxidase
VDQPLEKISAQQAKEIEPRVQTFQYALWSPSTSSANPRRVNAAFLEEARELGVEIRMNEKVLSAQNVRDGWRIRTERSEIVASEHIYNAAGLYADQVAKLFGFSRQYKVSNLERTNLG